MVPKAVENIGKFREVVSDPLNLLIRRHPLAGTSQDGFVILHNGNKVPAAGSPGAYYKQFSDLLAINRGVHEPLEEFAFQQLLDLDLGPAPVMIELGSYWGHYSMWLKQVKPNARVILVEPYAHRVEVGRTNFAANGYEGEFVQAYVGTGRWPEAGVPRFVVDDYLNASGLEHLDVLHADIQGTELQMLDGAVESLAAKRIGYLFISTHSNEIHYAVRDRLEAAGYRIEASSDYDAETTAGDGLVLASSPLRAAVLKNYEPAGRLAILEQDPRTLVERLSRMIAD